jgi:zinc transporter ZupT
VIALGLAIELIAAGLTILGLFLGEQRASTPLWAAVVVALIGLAVATAGVQRARPPRRSATPVLPAAPSIVDVDGHD